MSGARAALALLVAAGCGGGGDDPAPAARAPGATPWLEECARARGLVFEHVSGHREGRYLFPEIMGGGAALADLDGDGDLDAYLVQSGRLEPDGEAPARNRLFENDGRGRFSDRSAGSGADDAGYGMGVALGDADGDGDPDLYVTNVGPNALLRNEGGLRFSDASASARAGEPQWSASAAFFDADNDADLDLFVTNYVRWTPADERVCEQVAMGPDYCSPKAYRAPAPDTFLRNEGDGTFAERSSEAGLRATFGNGLGVLCTDFDGDGWMDVFVANDGTVNQLWHNGADGTFADEALLRGVGLDMDGTAKAGMGVAAADLDGDGDEELLVVNLTAESDSLHRNEGSSFSDRSAASGLASLTRGATRFGVAFVDLDNDGLADLFEANGRVSRAGQPLAADPYAEPNALLRQVSPWRFEEVLPQGGVARALVATSRAAAFGDVDGDGGVDVLVVNRDAPAHLLRNALSARGGWARLRVLDARGADALGARVRLVVAGSARTAVVRSAYSYDAASDPALHVGLGDAPAIERAEVTWVGGAREAFGPLAAGATHELRRGQGTALER